ncbi:MAG: 50S ribosomal protein L14e [Theionarchaea archaeon]|nr:50S ribosomal protein L14e [Theionarchaea archaeon]MBU7035526.1 50S ribosomal protein L14e [Theionarchaea archaeon]
MVMKVGRVCTKLVGREAGELCVVVDVVDRIYTVVTGPNVRRRKCNIKHLEPHTTVVSVEKGASDETVTKALENEGLV